MGEQPGLKPDLSVIILSWNACDDLRKCLQSIVKNPSRIRTEVVVADNASSDCSREMVRTEHPWVRLIVHPRNLGFGAGNNAAVPHTSGRYVLFLNSDTLVQPGAFDALVDFADANPDVGALGPKLLNADGTLQYSCRHFPNLGTGFFRNTPLGRLFPGNRFNTDYLMKDWDHETVRDVDWLSGAALMLPRRVWEVTGGFDEDFYFYCEDVDLCWRIHELGLRVTYVPTAVIYHLIGRSSDKVPARMTYEFHKSMYRFYRKHYAAKTPLFVRPLILPGIVARATGRILQYRLARLRRRLRGSPS